MPENDKIGLTTVSLTYHDWTLEIPTPNANIFELWNGPHLIFSGQLKLTSNNHSIDPESFHWQFRVKQSRIEQWCNVSKNNTLSIGMTYTFHHGALIIEYLARNSVPVKLDVRHEITQLDHSYCGCDSQKNTLENLKSWQRQYDGQPSDYLIEPVDRSICESFSSTQWVVLENSDQ